MITDNFLKEFLKRHKTGEHQIEFKSQTHTNSPVFSLDIVEHSKEFVETLAKGFPDDSVFSFSTNKGELILYTGSPADLWERMEKLWIKEGKFL